MSKPFYVTAFVIAHLSGQWTQAQDTSELGRERANLHFQTTYVYQYKPAFPSPYEGVNSLTGQKEEQNSITATLYLGLRLWKGAEVYVNPELAGGSGLSGALGMAGSSNGETFRVGNPSPTLYLARAYFLQTILLDKTPGEKVEDDANQLPGHTYKKYIRFYAGKFSLGDLFDNNNFSNSPREQFLNWALMNCGTWDYGANVRGYTFSFSTVLHLDQMSFKAGIAALPVEANGARLNTNFQDSFELGVNAEIDRAVHINNQEGNLRLLAFYNNARMGNYREAVHMPQPDVVATRQLYRTKWGLDLNFDQQLSTTAGIFGRFGYGDGRNEAWCFTEIDRTASLGISLNGKKWKRTDDIAGVAVVINCLSPDHRSYLAAGGSGFILGDGKLNYGAESIAELYYNVKPSKIPVWITGDYQFVLNPGYNKDRGPVHIFSLRAHVML
jgi:high affinity Mn2+ porin